MTRGKKLNIKDMLLLIGATGVGFYIGMMAPNYIPVGSDNLKLGGLALVGGVVATNKKVKSNTIKAVAAGFAGAQVYQAINKFTKGSLSGLDTYRS